MARIDICRKSPTKAHWFVEQLDKRDGNMGLFKCKYCKRIKWMPITYEAARGIESDYAI